MSIQKSCAKVKIFLNQLKEKINNKFGFLEGKVEVDAAQVFEAYRDSEIEAPNFKSYQEKIAGAQWKSLASEAQSVRWSMSNKSLRKVADFFGSDSMKDVTYQEVGSDSNTKEIRFFNTIDGQLNVYSGMWSPKNTPSATGVWEFVKSDGSISIIGKPAGDSNADNRILAKLSDNNIFEGVDISTIYDPRKRSGSYKGKLTRPDGSFFMGRMERDFKDQLLRIEGIDYWADGKKREEGQYRDNALVEGKKYSASGKLLTTINTLSDERRAAQAKIDREQIENRRIALEKQQQEEKAKQDEEAKISKMNPGELFAYADELSSRGRHDAAKKALRFLLSKYPDHPLAKVSAQQLTATPNSPSDSNPTSSKTYNYEIQSKDFDISKICSGAIPNIIYQKWQRFGDKTIRDAFNGTVIPYNSAIKNNCGAAPKSKCLEGVKNQILQWKSQLPKTINNYCTVISGCSSATEASLNWPEALASTYPSADENSVARTSAAQYVLLSIGIEYFTALEKYLNCKL